MFWWPYMLNYTIYFIIFETKTNFQNNASMQVFQKITFGATGDHFFKKCDDGPATIQMDDQ